MPEVKHMVTRPWRPGLAPQKDGTYDPEARKQKAGNSVEPAHRQPVWILTAGSEYWLPGVYNREEPGFWIKGPDGWLRLPDRDVELWGQRCAKR